MTHSIKLGRMDGVSICKVGLRLFGRDVKGEHSWSGKTCL